MNTMVSTAVIFVYLSPLQALNANNNACPNLVQYPFASLDPRCYDNPDVLSDFESMVRRHNYTCNNYTVTTDDGYILTVFRISSPNFPPTRCPVFLLHGIAESPALFINTANNSLGFNLIEMGYDVWLGTVRGTTYSTKHVSLAVSDPEYWNYNLDTLGQMDVPAQLNLVANETGRLGNILYIGHSMAGTLISIYCSNNYDEVSKLIQAIIGLAPGVYLTDSLPFNLISFPNQVQEVLQIKKMFYPEKPIQEFLVAICKFVPGICKFGLDVVGGLSNQFAAEDLLLIFSSLPTASSLYQYRQYTQIAQSNRFEKYDFGPGENVQKYGTVLPPTYNLSIIKMPIHLYTGLKDATVPAQNVERMYKEVGSRVKSLHKIPANNNFYAFNHFDFFFF